MAPPPTARGLARMRRLGDVALGLHRVSKPTIAKVDGVAVGAGLSLALGCDLVVCSDRARLSMIFSRRGLALDNGASWLLPRLVGPGPGEGDRSSGACGAPRRLPPSGWSIACSSCRRDGRLRRRLGHHAGRRPPLALSMSKTLLNASSMASMEQAVEDEARCQALNFSTKDTAEAIAAFTEKREPVFIGR